MKVDFIRSNYQRWYKNHKKEFDDAIQSCLKRGDLTLRQDVWDLEKNIAGFVGTKYCASVNSGTDALFLSLLALGIGKGDEEGKDEVISVSNTFVATLQAIVHVGAKPILVDVNADEQMNLGMVQEALTPRTKAIIPVHYTGSMVDMNHLKEITEIARNYNQKIFIVEDFCQALGAKKAGSYGDINAVSFNVAKLLGGMTDGGAITTNDKELWEKVCLLRNHWNIHQLSVNRNDYPQPDHVEWAWKSRLSNVNAAFLNVKFQYIKWIISRRRDIAMRYNQAFKDLPIGLPHDQEGRIWQEYHLRLQDKRELFAGFLRDNGIETLVRDSVPNHKMKGLKLEYFDLPVTERLARQVIRLPLYEWLEDKEVEYIIKKVKEFYATR